MTLSILWFVLIAVLWTVYLILEGFDFGVGMLLPFVAKGDRERTQTVRTIGPHWDGNEVWLLTAGGATFAAFPEWYATMFSGMYLALFLILVCLIIRVMALEWRSKVATEKWRHAWDWAHTVSAWLVPILLGVAFANFVQGMRIEVVDVATGTVIDPTLVNQSLATATHQLTGGFFSLLTPWRGSRSWLRRWRSSPRPPCRRRRCVMRAGPSRRPPLRLLARLRGSSRRWLPLFRSRRSTRRTR